MSKKWNAAERVRQRLNEWIGAAPWGSKGKLAASVAADYGKTKGRSWVTGLLKGRSDLRLRDLDAIAELLEVPPGELVRRDDDLYLEVNMNEWRMLMFFRSLPVGVQDHLLIVMDYLSQQAKT